MKKRTAIIVTVLALAALTAVPFVYAGPGGHGGHGRGHDFAAGMIFGHLREIQDELDLTDAQMDQIKAIFTELHQQNEASRENVHGGLHDAMRALLNNPNDLATAQAALDRQAAAEKQLKQSLLTATSKALNVLTPDQRAELSTIIQERMEQRSERRSSRR